MQRAHATLLVLAAAAATAAALPDASGLWRMVHADAGAATYSPERMRLVQCGGVAVVADATSVEYRPAAFATVAADGEGVVRVNYQPASFPIARCSVALRGNMTTAEGVCYPSGWGRDQALNFTYVCDGDSCATASRAAPAEGPASAGDVDVRGNWRSSTSGTCSSLGSRAWSPSYTLHQCGTLALLSPLATKVGANTASVTPGGTVRTGLLPGSPLTCSLSYSNNARPFLGGNCRYGGRLSCRGDLAMG